MFEPGEPGEYAEDIARFEQRSVFTQAMRETQIQQDRVPLVNQANVVRLDVAVNEALFVQSRQRLRGLPRDPQGHRRLKTVIAP